MVNAKYILPAGIILLLLYMLVQHYRSLCVMEQQEELLHGHLKRLRIENKHDGLLLTNAAQHITTRSYLLEKYLNSENKLKPEFAYIPADTNDLLISLAREHISKERLHVCLTEFFTHTDMVLTHLRVIKKSILDDRVHMGIERYPHIEGKYEVEINNVPFPYADDHLYTFECTDTLNLVMKMYIINYKTGGVDTTFFKEQLIVSNL